MPRVTQEAGAAQKAPRPGCQGGWESVLHQGVSPALLIKPPQGGRGERPGRGATEKSSSRVQSLLACGPAGPRVFATIPALVGSPSLPQGAAGHSLEGPLWAPPTQGPRQGGGGGVHLASPQPLSQTVLGHRRVSQGVERRETSPRLLRHKASRRQSSKALVRSQGAFAARLAPC